MPRIDDTLWKGLSGLFTKVIGEAKRAKRVKKAKTLTLFAFFTLFALFASLVSSIQSLICEKYLYVSTHTEILRDVG